MKVLNFIQSIEFIQGEQMRLSIVKSKSTKILRMIKATYENGKHSTKIVENLGNTEHLK